MAGYEAENKIRLSVEKAAKKYFENHKAKKLYGDGEFGVWECRNPDDGFYHFYLASSPGCLTFYGDFETLSVNRGTDVLNWALEHCESHGYFASKFNQTQKIQIFSVEKFTEACEEVANEMLADLDEDENLNEIEAINQELQEILDRAYDGMPESEAIDLFTEFSGDREYDFRVYTRGFYLFVEALKWFKSQLTQGLVVE